MKKLLLTSILISGYIISNAQCADTNKIYTFYHNSHTYEVVKENKNWVNAAACAVQRGGYLVEVNNQVEQDTLFSELVNRAGIVFSQTKSVFNWGTVWLGGNDFTVEGNWIWDGNNDGTGSQFWMGNHLTGVPVGGLYNKWGNEPDNSGGQDALSMTLQTTGRNLKSEWNDLDRNSNSLYYIIEYDFVIGIGENEFEKSIDIYPNPFNNELFVNTNDVTSKISNAVIYNSLGKEIKVLNSSEINQKKVDVSFLLEGVYFISINFEDGNVLSKKIVK